MPHQQDGEHFERVGGIAIAMSAVLVFVLWDYKHPVQLWLCGLVVGSTTMVCEL
jgi:UDP-N-acetylmuramyl pentapeptide phosphotransferase/UDP-N-acetylglucosamine-1-phosphate transferase